jgi:hypothetical protein
MFCRNCGKQIPDASTVCVHCGAAVAPSTQPTPSGYQQPSAIAHSASMDHIGSVGLYFSTLFGSIGVFIIGGIAMAGDEDAGMGFIVIGFLVLIVAVIASYVLLYQIWRYVITESEHHRLIPSIETPGKAVGYCFIPFYNLYWIFQAFGKFPKDFNALASAKSSNQMMSEGLGTAIPVLTILSIIPVVGYFAAGIAIFILEPMFFRQATRLCKEMQGMRAASAPAMGVSFS